MSLSETIRRLRGETGLTQYKFALMLGVAPNTVKGWENGTIRSMNHRNLKKLQDALRLSRARIVELFYDALDEAPAA